MRFFKTKTSWVISTLLLATGYFVSCEHDELIVPDAAELTSARNLTAVKTATPPEINGAIDAAWADVPKLQTSAIVPDPGNNLFSGYINDQYAFTLRSMYDDQYVYFLAEVPDNTKSVYVATWYYNPATKLWVQESTSRQYDANGVMTRNGFGEDKFALLWNIDNSTPKFSTQTCYASCHVFSPYTDYSVTPSVVRANNASGNHYTNGSNEKIDMWWAHLGRDVLYKQMDDNYQDWAGGAAVTNLTGGNANGRHVDDLVVNGTAAIWPFRPNYSTAVPQGSSNNRQSLKLDGTGTAVNVPLWIIPGETNYYHIAATDTLQGGKAKKVTGVSTTGVLTYDGGSIDPAVGTDYQRTGDPVNGTNGSKCFPSYISSPLIGGRADITCAAVHDGTKWIVEFKRKLKTNDILKQDVSLNDLENHEFGVAVWDRSNNQHGIAPGLTLTFKK